MALSAFALVTLDEASQHMIGRTNAQPIEGIQVYHNGTGVTEATVTISSTALVLHTDLADVTLTFADADKDTLLELAVKINAEANWIAALLGPSDADSASLNQVYSLDVLLYSKMATLMTSGDWILERIVDGVSYAIQEFTDCFLNSASYTEYFDGGFSSIIVRNRPLTAISRIAIGHLDVLTVFFNATAERATIAVTDTTVTLTSTTTGVVTSNNLTISDYASLDLLAAAIVGVTDWSATVSSPYGPYPAGDLVPFVLKAALSTNRGTLAIWGEEALVRKWNSDAGIIYLASRVPKGRNTLKISYTGGFVSIPNSLKMLTYEMINQVWDNGLRDNSLRTERFADHSWTAKESLFDRNAKERLAHYMRATL